MKNKRYIELVAHCSFWVTFTFLIIKGNLIEMPYLPGDLIDIPVLIGSIINVILYYLNYLILFKLYRSNKISTIKYFIILIVCFSFFSVIEILVDLKIAKYYGAYINTYVIYQEIILTAVIHIFVLIFSFINGIVKEWIRNEIIKKQLIEEKLTAELKLLKSQISPHFLFNTINNLYSVAIKNNDNETARGLTKLSNLMRFMFEKTEEENIRIKDEVEYLNSYIELQKLRFSKDDDIEIQFVIECQNYNYLIPSFLLIVFIENAFKHGINFREKSFININLKVENNTLQFYCENSVPSKKINNTTQTGLINVKKRLELIFKTKYKLSISSDNNIYKVKLVLKENKLNQ